MNLNSTDTRQIQKFGITALIFFGSLHALGLWVRKPLPTYLFGFLSILGLGFISFPCRLKSVYSTWQKITYFFCRIVNALILILAYYLVITPSALMKRLFGGPPLPMAPDKKTSSYWVVRSDHMQPKQRYLKRY